MPMLLPLFVVPINASHPRHLLLREFHVKRAARDHYQFPHLLFATSGRVVFANFAATRLFAQKMNEKRDLARFPETAVKAGQINAMGLFHEILHHLIAQYQQQNGPVFGKALERMESAMGREQLDATLLQFSADFPPLSVYRGEQTLPEYFAGATAGVSHRELALEEMLMLWLSNSNPASKPYLELFDDKELAGETGYPDVIAHLQGFFETQPTFGPERQSLIDLLCAPILARPDSFTAQLEFVLKTWVSLLGERFRLSLLQSLDFVKEEEKATFYGPGPSIVPEFGRGGNRGGRGRTLDEPERFSPDRDWMPRAVIMAKNSYVWLEQLARKYGRDISRLDQIPDEELDFLAGGGFTGLWLIGLWQRSRASQQIKRMCGSADAVASAYSLLSYEIADDLGGWAALENLRHRAWQRGIRMTSDMVPNHMGIDSDWVIEHPDWFLSLPYSPFPSYSFNGANLSPRDGIGIYLEDHYYDRTDAAVVFKRVDFGSGETRYIYHGNDGTSMPWNDTAQLNYLQAQVREAVIQTILHVARNFPIIRFDAAMTLAKKHCQRLWFPEPGHGGAIPSRAEHSMTADDFDRAFPEEFWREVVDRVAQEVPDTLLLAEAFWMMEGYFVRTLGMHRVYNSAFMNMLRDEENDKYRQAIKNTLEFDPEILKRYVNFMNNPDEETAIEQFGNGDKYFGIATLMCTLPGLPMFGHGQIEGFHEKYGMEYRSAKWQEDPDSYLVDRHAREIFPLLHRRSVFAEVENFVLYDFWHPGGGVDENVFAYSNRQGDERALVIYHNRYATVSGWIRTSVGALDKGSRQIRQHTLGEAMGLNNESNRFTIFRDLASNLEFIRSSAEVCEKGLFVELHAYDRHVFLDWREVEDDASHRYAQLAQNLSGRGVPSIQTAIREMELRPVLDPFTQLVNAETLRALMPKPRVVAASTVEDSVERDALTVMESAGDETAAMATQSEPKLDALKDVDARLQAFLEAVKNSSGGKGDIRVVATEIRARLATALQLPDGLSGESAVLVRAKLNDSASWGTLLGWVFVHDLGKVLSPSDVAATSRAWLGEWMLAPKLEIAFQELGLDAAAAAYAVTIIKIVTRHQDWWASQSSDSQALLDLFGDDDVHRALGVNRHEGVLYFNAESWQELTTWLLIIAAVLQLSAPEVEASQMARCLETIEKWRNAADKAGYQVEKLLEAISEKSTLTTVPAISV